MFILTPTPDVDGLASNLSAQYESTSLLDFLPSPGTLSEDARILINQNGKISATGRDFSFDYIEYNGNSANLFQKQNLLDQTLKSNQLKYRTVFAKSFLNRVLAPNRSKGSNFHLNQDQLTKLNGFDQFSRVNHQNIHFENNKLYWISNENSTSRINQLETTHFSSLETQELSEFKFGFRTAVRVLQVNPILLLTTQDRLFSKEGNTIKAISIGNEYVPIGITNQNIVLFRKQFSPFTLAYAKLTDSSLEAMNTADHRWRVLATSASKKKLLLKDRVNQSVFILTLR